MILTFTIPGRPVGKGRPRVTKSGHAYTPERTREYERLAALCATTALLQLRGWRMDADYALSVQTYISHTKKGARRTARGGCPDLDNVIKAVSDALEGIAYEGDEQVIGIVDSWTHHGAEDERTDVRLEVIGGNDGG